MTRGRHFWKAPLRRALSSSSSSDAEAGNVSPQKGSVPAEDARPVSPEEFRGLTEEALQFGPPRTWPFERPVVWVNGNAASVALALLTAAHVALEGVSERASRRVLAILTHLPERASASNPSAARAHDASIQRLARSLTSRGLQVVTLAVPRRVSKSPPVTSPWAIQAQRLKVPLYPQGRRDRPSRSKGAQDGAADEAEVDSDVSAMSATFDSAHGAAVRAVVREMHQYGARTLLSWQYLECGWTGHLQRLGELIAGRPAMLADPVLPRDVSLRSTMYGVPANTVEVVRPFLLLPVARLEVTCREFGVLPLPEADTDDDEQAFWRGRLQQLLRQLSAAPGTSSRPFGDILAASQRLFSQHSHRLERASRALLRESVFESSGAGWLVLRRPSVDAALMRPDLEVVVVHMAMRLLRFVGGGAAASRLSAMPLRRVLREAFQSPIPGPSVVANCWIRRLRIIEPYVIRQRRSVRYTHDYNTAARLIGGTGGRHPSQQFSDFVVVARERGREGLRHALVKYRLPLGLDEWRYWDSRFLVGVQRALQEKSASFWPAPATGAPWASASSSGTQPPWIPLAAPPSAETEAELRLEAAAANAALPALPAAASGSAKGYGDGSLRRRSAPHTMLDALLGEILRPFDTIPDQYRPVSSRVDRRRYPFVVRPLAQPDLDEILKRSPEMRSELRAVPSNVLFTLPLFERDGDILAVPTLNLHYEPSLNCVASYRPCFADLPEDLDPSSVPVRNWR